MIPVINLWEEHEALMPAFLGVFRDMMEKSAFIGGEGVRAFEQNLGAYLGSRHVVSCANGTDALQIAYMALGLVAGDEVVVPDFNYIAAAEAAAVLGITVVLADVCPHTFCITPQTLQNALTPNTKAVVVVHLFGQCADMQPILSLCATHKIAVIEDAAQSLGAEYTFTDGTRQKAGTMGDVGTTSFFPTKNLGGLGDGGAIFTKHDDLAPKIRQICNHGQTQKYQHQRIGLNSRLDNMQAAFLDIKLKNLDENIEKRQKIADFYDKELKNIVATPHKSPQSTHTYNQYTIILAERNALKSFLEQKQIATMVYYPLSLQQQNALKHIAHFNANETSHALTQGCLSLPISPSLTTAQQEIICQEIKIFFKS